MKLNQNLLVLFFVVLATGCSNDENTKISEEEYKKLTACEMMYLPEAEKQNPSEKYVRAVRDVCNANGLNKQEAKDKQDFKKETEAMTKPKEGWIDNNNEKSSK